MESRLKGIRIYLSGPCEAAKEDGGEWRKLITPKLKKLGMTIYDPVNHPGKLSWGTSKLEEFTFVKNLRKEGRFEDLAKCMREVCHFDLRMVDSSDCLIVQLDENAPTTGGIDEIVTACNQKKPVYICSKQGKKTIPLWLFGRVPTRYIFESLDEIVQELTNIAHCSDEELNIIIDNKRWLFLNNLGI